jgi:hypothetical protein
MHDPSLLARAVDAADFDLPDDTGGIRRFIALREAAGSPAVIEVRRPQDVDDTVLAIADILILTGFTPRQVTAVRDRALGRIPRLEIAVKAAAPPLRS